MRNEKEVVQKIEAWKDTEDMMGWLPDEIKGAIKALDWVLGK